jgi:1-aminocyclopropane-1-carboxylate deaminase/D-cysteine desulfhydrase-like pyridoxal-dependent ACC family enzyme
VEPDLNEPKANLLLDYIYGAEVHIVSVEPGKSEQDAEERSFKMAAEHIRRLEQAGKRPYSIPMGGASPIGSLGFIGGFVELTRQMADLGEYADYLFHATGTGGTLAGLAAGRALLGSETKIVPIAVSPKDEGYERRTANLANAALCLIKATETVQADDIAVDRNYFAPGYEIPNPAGNNAIRRLARTEGILTDTVYSGKAFAGLLDYVERIPRGSTVVFWHTGGATALFAEKEIIGDIAKT